MKLKFEIKPTLFKLNISLFTAASLALNAAELTHSQNQLDDLTRYFPADQIKTVMAAEQSIPVLINEQTGPSARGKALLLPDINLQAYQSQSFSNLPDKLNDYGWVTIGSIAPNDLTGVWQLNEEQAKTLTAQPIKGAEQISEADASAVKTQLKIMLNALNTEAENYPGLVLYVAQGATAGWLIEALSAGDIQLPDTLVLISPYLPEYQLNKNLAKKIANLDIPVLDIWSEFDNRWALATVKHRQQAAKKYLTLHYRQRQLFARTGLNPRDNRLAKEIYAYITYLGW
ncbi:alpha/beta hydrolase family protein [Catenovulum sp. 2E275]|uniref:alpha/beta hydrolase family protein n=1 Tax=Catenovulum sp. 2E275 TaxID=2980497 RepID=UPI0021D1E0A0|nr:alpha/beta hydrolase family protein [Catenovulum sp. 2E275]MCU4677433.1 alpha/beta hydrolase family protein [Catenovulum sp. 2E275]